MFNIEKIFLYLSLVFGSFFVFLTPPFQGPDEPDHFYRSLILSSGHINIYRYQKEMGALLPDDTATIVDKFTYLRGNRGQKVNIFYILDLFKLKSSNKYQFIPVTSMEGAASEYPPIPYIFPAFGIIIGRLFNLNPLALMYLSRVTNLLSWIIITYFAIRIIPIKKNTLTIIALLPMSLFIASTLSADTLTNSLSFLFIAITLKYAYDPKNTPRHYFKLLVSIILLLSLCKPPYFLVSILILLIPISLYKHINKSSIHIILLILCPIVIYILWLKYIEIVIGPTIHAGIFAPSYKPNPIILFPNHLLKTLIDYKELYTYQFIGYFGWLDTPIPFKISLYYLLIPTLYSLIDVQKNNLLVFKKYLIFLTFTAIFLLIFLLFYRLPLEKNYIRGVQGRYFIPIAILPFLIFPNFYRIFKYKSIIIFSKILIAILPVLIFLILLTSCVTLIDRYYFTAASPNLNFFYQLYK